MNMTPLRMQDLARRLIALEAERDPSDGPSDGAVRVCAKLRAPLVKLVGVAGFCSLLSRSLAVAKADLPALEMVQVQPDGSLEGLERLGPTHGSEPGVVVVARLLGLLATFIGEPLALGLVRFAWSDACIPGIDAGTEEGS